MTGTRIKPFAKSWIPTSFTNQQFLDAKGSTCKHQIYLQHLNVFCNFHKFWAPLGSDAFFLREIELECFDDTIF